MSTRNFISSGQNFAHPLQDDRWIAHSTKLCGVVLDLMHVNTTYQVTLLYANGIHMCDIRHAVTFVSWIETFIFIRGGVIFSNDTQ